MAFNIIHIKIYSRRLFWVLGDIISNPFSVFLTGSLTPVASKIMESSCKPHKV